MQKYFLVLSVFFLFGFKQSEDPSGTPLPNIVFIFTDDLGYGDLGCFGAKDVLTPHIDKIAKEGIQFTEFYSAAPVCSPSRAGLLTGRLPQRMGINNVFFPESFTGMPAYEITIADMLQKKGYSTGIVGKWHLGHLQQYLPLQRGFQSYYGIPYSNDMESIVYMKDNTVDSFHVNQRYTTQTYTQQALSFIEKNSSKPFFLYLAHNMPHVPIYASPAFEGKSQRGLYGDVIQEIDWSVGQILDKLEKEGLLNNTLVIFSSDNGPWLAMQEYGGSAGILREGKQYTFEGGMRVPTVAMWKGTIPAGMVYKDMATQMDWFPTFLHFAGIEPPQDRPIDGENIADVLLGKGKRKGDTFLYFDGASLEGIRKGDWKLKLPYEGYRGTPGKKAVAAHDTLLFNLKSDPSEQNNLAQLHKERVRQLSLEMQAQKEKLGNLPPSLVHKTPQDRSHLIYLENKQKP